MRADVPLYIIAIICFASAIGLQLLAMQEVVFAYILTLMVLGVIFVGVGYSMRPKQAALETEEKLVPTEIEKAEEAPTIKEGGIVIEAKSKPSLDLTDVKGIGPKRAGQLRKVGIQSVEDLAKESPEELSRKAKVSVKIAEKWIDSAKKILEKN